MPDPGEIPSRALRGHGLKPRKRLGQNFLQDRSALAKIVAAAEVCPGDRILEIGAGTGALTAVLADNGARVLAMELDDGLYELLQNEFAGRLDVEILHRNALDLDPCDYFPGTYKLVANIPYYITGPILRHYLEAECSPKLLVMMVQLEVARRMAAPPGELSLLGLSVQWYAQPKVMARIPAGAFYPAPNVDSAIIRLVPHRLPERVELRDALFQVAHAGFGTRRKQLVNAVGAGLGIGSGGARRLLEEARIDPSRRAETLDLDEWERLARAWKERGN